MLMKSKTAHLSLRYHAAVVLGECAESAEKRFRKLCALCVLGGEF